jgi:hypothetical protein
LTSIETATAKWGRKTIKKEIVHYKTASHEKRALFNRIGPLAMEGYGGSGLCKDCKSGDQTIQFFNVTDCRSDEQSKKCFDYVEELIAGPARAIPAEARCSGHFSVPSAGTYKFTFPQTIPATVTKSAGHMVTRGPYYWDAVVTKSCHGPTAFDFVVIITKTVVVKEAPKTVTVSG